MYVVVLCTVPLLDYIKRRLVSIDPVWLPGVIVMSKLVT